MTWQGDRRKQLPADWPRRRRIRLNIDGGRCTQMIDGQRCTALATEVHHASAADDHRIESLRSLCGPHHAEHTQLEAQQARGVGPMKLRPRRPHPGLRTTDPGGGPP